VSGAPTFELESRVRRIVGVVNRLDRGRGDVTMAERREADAGLSKRLGWVVMPRGPAPAQQRDLLVPVEGGRIRVRLYVPRGSGPFPLHVFLHGGGWCVGAIGARDPRCLAIVAGAACIVASVEYRLAPENLYPTAPEDSYAALCWLVDHADELGIDTTRVAVGGESAGGNLAAVVCLMARDRDGPTIVHQWLDVPATDLTMSQPSVHNTPDGYLLTYRDMVEYRDSYLPDVSLATEPYASPLHAAVHGPGLRGLPPARILTCGADPLRDDGRVYAAALTAAGVPVEHVHLSGHVHPSFAFTRLVRSAAAEERAAIASLARAFGRDAGSTAQPAARSAGSAS
jgi:acetyl esterase